MVADAAGDGMDRLLVLMSELEKRVRELLRNHRGDGMARSDSAAKTSVKFPPKTMRT